MALGSESRTSVELRIWCTALSASSQLPKFQLAIQVSPRKTSTANPSSVRAIPQYERLGP